MWVEATGVATQSQRPHSALSGGFPCPPLSSARKLPSLVFINLPAKQEGCFLFQCWGSRGVRRAFGGGSSRDEVPGSPQILPNLNTWLLGCAVA